jgi:hypothetical protein
MPLTVTMAFWFTRRKVRRDLNVEFPQDLVLKLGRKLLEITEVVLRVECMTAIIERAVL